MQKKKLIIALIALVLASAMLVSGTLAWRDYTQHKTNQASGGEELLYTATLIEDYAERKDWKAEQGAVKKQVRVSNDGLTNGDYGPVYVRLQLKDYMEISKLRQAFTDVRYMIDTSGNFIRFETQAEAQAAYPNHGTARLTDAIRGVTGWFIQTQAKDPNGQYGKFMCIQITKDAAVSVLPGYTRADYDADVNHLIVPNGECAYHIKPWDGSKTAIDDFVKVTLGKDVVLLADWDGKSAAKWILASDGWIYWGQALNPGEISSNLVESLELLKNPDGSFYYALHVDMQSLPYDKLGDWSDMPPKIKDSYGDEEVLGGGTEVFEQVSNRRMNPVDSINLTSPVGQRTTRFFTTTGDANDMSMTQLNTGGTANASFAPLAAENLISLADIDGRTRRLVIPAGYTGTITIAAADEYTITVNVTANDAMVNPQEKAKAARIGETFEADGVEWRVLMKENDQALIYAEHALAFDTIGLGASYVDTGFYVWMQDFYSKLKELPPVNAEKNVPTLKGDFNTTDEYRHDVLRVFPLSMEELGYRGIDNALIRDFGDQSPDPAKINTRTAAERVNGGTVIFGNEYAMKQEKVADAVSNAEKQHLPNDYFTRTPALNNKTIPYWVSVTPYGAAQGFFMNYYRSYAAGFRPAMFIWLVNPAI
ncbi:MAG: hypothetical protein LBT21_00525 [Oscillospiraceae bacterium]|jgi:hypothetical protein|nr:hypothetical protein [Oscillospiraceae bacterium]